MVSAREGGTDDGEMLGVCAEGHSESFSEWSGDQIIPWQEFAREVIEGGRLTIVCCVLISKLARR